MPPSCALQLPALLALLYAHQLHSILQRSIMSLTFCRTHQLVTPWTA